MKQPRITLRKLMIAVALAAIASWCVVLWWRSQEYAAKAREHSHRLGVCKLNREGVPINPMWQQSTWESMSDSEKEDRVDWDRWILYEERLVRKYQRAAQFPWIVLEVDPPPPSAYRP